MSWLATVATLALAALAFHLTGWGGTPDGVWMTLVVVLALLEWYRLPAGVHSQTELSAVLTVVTVALYLTPTADLVVAAAIAALAGSLSRGRWGAAARTEVVAATAATSAAVTAHTLVAAQLPQTVAVSVSVGCYALVHLLLTAAHAAHAEPSARTPAKVYLASAAVQLLLGITTWHTFRIDSTLAATRFLLVGAAVYLWLVLWRYVRTWEMAVAIIRALPDSAMPPLEDLAEALAQVADAELVSPYTSPEHDRAEQLGGLDVEVALLARDGSCRVYRLEAGDQDRPQGAVGWWCTVHPAWVTETLSRPEVAEFGTTTDEHRLYLAVGSGSVTGPAVAIRVPVVEETWPGRRRLRALAEMYAGCVSILLAKYRAAPRCRSTQLAAACERLLALVDARASADRVAEQVDRVRALTAVSLSWHAANDEGGSAPRTPGEGVPLGHLPAPAQGTDASPSQGDPP